MFRFFSCACLLLVLLCPAQALDVNQASEAELDGLRGIGPPFTRRLMAARAQQPFQDWSDLMQRVSGMGPRVAQSLSDQGLTVQGHSLPCQLRVEKSSALKLTMPQKPCVP
ncbi:MAG: ComEA family DNA-binding protein [Limnohabitans sp.]